ncbi:hypothetical protein, partial [Streptococcus suis]
KAFLFCPDGVVSALKQPFFSKNSKKDKHQNDVCLQSEIVQWTILARANCLEVRGTLFILVEFFPTPFFITILIKLNFSENSLF